MAIFIYYDSSLLVLSRFIYRCLLDLFSSLISLLIGPVGERRCRIMFGGLSGSQSGFRARTNLFSLWMPEYLGVSILGRRNFSVKVDVETFFAHKLAFTAAGISL